MTGKLRDLWILVVPFFLMPPELHSAVLVFKRSICLQVAEEFISIGNPCKIKLGEIKELLTERSESSMCESQIFCRVYFSYHSTDGYSKFYQFREAQQTVINGLGEESTTRTTDYECSGSSNRKRTLYIDVFGGCKDDKECAETEICFTYSDEILNKIGTCVCMNGTMRINGICRKIDVELGGPCSEDIQCSKAGYNRLCDKTTSTCVCIDGFTDVNGHCVHTRLEVNQTCWFDEQCNGTANSNVCRRNVCDCMAEHYYADGACRPSKDTDVGNTQRQQLLQENKDFSVAQIIAAVIGGFVFGILACFTAIYVLKIRNRRNKEARNTEAKFVNNISYEGEISTKDQKDLRNLEQAKISHVRPIIKGNQEYSNVSQVKPVTNDIYNHLNEKMGDDTDMDEYDHALTVATGVSTDEEYGNLSRCAQHSANLQTYIVPHDDYDVAKVPEHVDDYFTLERQ